MDIQTISGNPLSEVFGKIEGFEGFKDAFFKTNF
jgi:hypothetical protein